MERISLKKIGSGIPLEDIRRDINHYCAEEIEPGATDSRAVSAIGTAGIDCYRLATTPGWEVYPV
ncbi:MAG: hypothetical protein ACUVWJ_02365, partial [Spirochaetota bacterium]